MSESSGGYTKSLQVLEAHFSLQNDHNNHLAIIKSIHFPYVPDQKWGVKNNWHRFLQNILIDFTNFQIFKFQPFSETIYCP